MARRDDLPLFPAPHRREVYDHLRAAERHIHEAQELLRVKRRPTPRLQRMREELQEMFRALRAAP